MKIRSRFFITFFCFALFFSLSSYVAQDYLFKHSQNNENIRVDDEVRIIKNSINNDDNDTFLKQYLIDRDIILDKIFLNPETNSIIVKKYNTEKSFNFNQEYYSYRNQSEIDNACRNISLLPERTKAAKVSINDKSYMSQTFCAEDNAIYIAFSPFSEYTSAIMLLQQSYLLIITFTVLMSAIISFILARYIAKPITQINYMTKQLSNLDFSQKLSISGNDEIAELATNINILSNKLHHSIDKLKENIIKEKQANEDQIQLFASMSHELKTPITILKGTLEGIKDRIGSYKNPYDYIDSMIEETDNMENIVLNLLNYAKFSLEDKELKMSAADLEDLLCESVNRLNYLIDEKNINIETNIIDENVMVDKASINIVLKNILENAIHYSENNSKIEIFTSSFTDYVLVQVINHGTNIPSASLNYIFEPFYRADNSRLAYKNGTGLGLSIVKQILDKYHSNYSIYNINDDEYAVCFEFTLLKEKKNN